MARAPNVNQLFAEQFSFRAPVTPQRLAMPPQDTLQSAPVSWRDRMKDALGGVIGRHNAEMAVQVADFTPLGAVFAANEARLAADRGGYGEAAGGLAMAALPIPAARGAGKVAREVAQEVPTISTRALPMDEASRMARAAEMGFDTATPMYRGMSRPYDVDKTGNYQMFTSSPLDAGEYAGEFEGANVLPALIARGKGALIDAGGANWNAIPRSAIPKDIAAKLHPSVGGQVRTDEFIHAAKEAGYDSATIQNVFDNIDGVIRNKPRPSKVSDSELDALLAELGGFDLANNAGVNVAESMPVNYAPVTVHAAFDPANIRSRFAAFDPAKRNSKNLMAGVAGAGVTGAATITTRSQSKDDGSI